MCVALRVQDIKVYCIVSHRTIKKKLDAIKLKLTLAARSVLQSH